MDVVANLAAQIGPVVLGLGILGLMLLTALGPGEAGAQQTGEHEV